MAFVSELKALIAPTAIADFKTAMDVDLAWLEAASTSFTSSVLALPASHNPHQWRDAVISDYARLQLIYGAALTVDGYAGKEKWSVFMTAIKADGTALEAATPTEKATDLWSAGADQMVDASGNTFVFRNYV